MNWLLLQNSLLVSGAATLLAAGFGLGAALWLAGLPSQWRNRLLAVAVMALALPPFLVTNCWLHYLGHTGLWRPWFPFTIISPGGTIWILSLLTWPITLLAVWGAWQRLEPAQLESDPAVTGWTLMQGLLLPLARNALVQASLLTFVLTLNNFAVPAILQVKVFPAEMWVRFSSNFDTLGALALSWPLVLGPLLLLVWLRRREISWPRLEGPVSAKLFRRQLGHGWFWSCGALTVVICVLAVGLPLWQLISVKRTWTELPGALAAGQGAIASSVLLAIAAATVVIGLALAVASRFRIGTLRDGGRSSFIGWLLWLPFLIPGVLLGVGWIWLFNRPWTALFYQSAGIVIFAFVIRYLALGWNSVIHARQAVDRDLTDAARLEGASHWQLLKYVHWPQIAPQVAAAWYIVFLLCLWDVESMVLITPPGGETVALRVFNLLHYGHNAQVNALCLTLLALAVAPLLLWKACSGVRRIWRENTNSPAVPPTSRPGGTSDNSPTSQRLSLLASFVQVCCSAVRRNPVRGGLCIEPAHSLFLLFFVFQRRLHSPNAFQSQTVPQRLEHAAISLGAAEKQKTINCGPRSIHRSPLTGLSARLQHELERVSWVSALKLGGLASIVLLFLAGCTPSPANTSHLDSHLFSSVQVIGTRGVGLGQVNKPRSVAVDRQDNLFVVDMTGRVQKFSPAGVFQCSWQMPQTDLGKPKGMGRDREGNIIVVEPHYQRVNHFTPTGKLVAQWGERGTNAGQFMLPRAVAVNSRNEIMVSEYGTVERVQRFNLAGLASPARTGSAGIPAGSSSLPSALAGKDAGAPSNGGVPGSKPPLLGGFGQTGTGPGEFNRPEGLCVDSQDRIYVADSCNHRIQVFTNDGRFLRAYGKAGRRRGELSYPYDICVDAAGRQYVCEFGNSRIQVFDANDQSIEIIGCPGPGPGQFNNPWGVALDSAGNLYVADSQNHRVQKLIRNQEIALRQ